MERIAVARIGKTHGVKGYLKIQSFSGEYEHLSGLEECEIRFKTGKSRIVRVQEINPFGDRALIKFADYDNPEDARNLTGGEMWAEQSFAAPLRDGEYYISDLIGCEVIFEGEIQGKVVGVAEIGQADLLEVKTVEKGFRYLPLKEEYVGRVSVVDKTIELAVKWILE